MSRVSDSFRLSIVSYMVSYSGSDSVLGKKSVLNSGLGSSSIFFIIGYQSF
jgi:hypothetical protein